MTTATPLARFSAVEGALACGFVTADLRHVASISSLAKFHHAPSSRLTVGMLGPVCTTRVARRLLDEEQRVTATKPVVAPVPGVRDETCPIDPGQCDAGLERLMWRSPRLH
ncbi:MAG: hypothetical protein EOQ46_26230 [Mesorhizobium sp.]|nr:MAG: hypothetical protein EOQ46_26230 [Mesorhizobium sp.]